MSEPDFDINEAVRVILADRNRRVALTEIMASAPEEVRDDEDLLVAYAVLMGEVDDSIARHIAARVMAGLAPEDALFEDLAQAS